MKVVLLSETDLIDTKRTCQCCGAPVGIYLCNGDLIKKRPAAAEWDRWLSCTNADCEKHEGEGHFQGIPDWVRRS